MHATAHIVAIIPARLASTRLARKALLPIAGTPMVGRVYAAVHACARLRATYVATDSEEIRAYCAAAAIPALMTSPRHVSGTDRVGEAVDQLLARGERVEAVVNAQGDEPMTRPEMISALLDALFAAPETQVATLCAPLPNPEDIANPAVVKLVRDQAGRALYFSRAGIPFLRDAGAAPQPAANYAKHLGFYAYSPRALSAFRAWTPTPLETAEKLEQLRFLENGCSIAVAAVPRDTIGVDTAEDLARVEAYFRSRPL